MGIPAEDKKCTVTETHSQCWGWWSSLYSTVAAAFSKQTSGHEWCAFIVNHQQARGRKWPFKKNGSILLKQGLFLFRRWPNFWHPKWEPIPMYLPEREQYSVGVKLSVYNFSRVCQCVCICIAAEEDSSGRLCSKESDGAEGRWGHSLLFIIVEARGGAEDGEGRGDTRVPGAPTLPPSAVFPSALTGGTLSLGDWKNPAFTVSSGI